MPITDPELRVIATSFQMVANSAFNSAENETAKAEIVKLLNDAMRNYTREWRAESKLGCPPGWTECPDGSCAPDSSGCGREMSFKEVNAYIAEAAGAYFASAQNETMQVRTRELLQDARQSFETQFILGVQPASEAVAG